MLAIAATDETETWLKRVRDASFVEFEELEQSFAKRKRKGGELRVSLAVCTASYVLKSMLRRKGTETPLLKANNFYL